MQPVLYSINITLDGCCDHQSVTPDPEMHQHATDLLAGVDALLFGRKIYQLMEFWRPIAAGSVPDGIADWMLPFARVIDVAKKYVVSDSLEEVDWNTELVRGRDLESTVQKLKAQEGRGILVGGVQMPLALAELGLIDDYEFIVHPRIAGHGPTLFAGLSKFVDLKLVDRKEFGSGAVVLRYQPVR